MRNSLSAWSRCSFSTNDFTRIRVGLFSFSAWAYSSFTARRRDFHTIITKMSQEPTSSRQTCDGDSLKAGNTSNTTGLTFMFPSSCCAISRSYSNSAISELMKTLIFRKGDIRAGIRISCPTYSPPRATITVYTGNLGCHPDEEGPGKCSWPPSLGFGRLR